MASITITAKEREERRKGGGSSGSGGRINSGSNSSNTSYDRNTDYANLIDEAIKNGASREVIDDLNRKRNAKIAGEGLNYKGYSDDDIGGLITSYSKTGSTGSKKFNPTESAMDALRRAYGITDPTVNPFKDFNANVDFDSKIAALQQSGADQDTIDAMIRQKEYSEGVRNGTIIPYGYGPAMGYNNRNTKFLFNMDDGSKKAYFGNETRWEDAARNSGFDGITGLADALTYGTASSAYAKPGYGFGTIMGPADFTTEVRNNDEDGRLFNMNNMNLSFLSGRDGMEYSNPDLGMGYTGNGLINAYNKGKEFEGLGQVMGRSSGYDPIGSYNDADLPAEALAQIREWQKQYMAAKAEYDKTGSFDAYQAMQNAHAAAESIRAQFGYSGGIDGSAYLGWGSGSWGGSGTFPGGGFPGGTFPGGAPGWGTNSLPEYESPYQDEIDELLGELLSYDEFVYKLDTDPLYQQYRAQYVREGDRALQDTLASAASGAGGMNSFAVSAAQQANNYYTSQLNDRVPELYSLAYQKYLNEFDQKLQSMGVLEGLENTAYGQYRDEVSDWFNNRDFNYNAYINDRDFNYGKYRDTIEDSRYDQEWEYNVSANDRNNAYNQAMDFLSMGIMPSADILNKAGISVNEAQNYISALLSSRKKKSSGSSGGSGKKKKEDDEPKYKTSDLGEYAQGLYTDLLKKGYSPEDLDEAITNQFNKKYITKKEADILAGLLIMEE
nr:MAG TPA: hypothetical protein [Caudoviricetes sp.]